MRASSSSSPARAVATNVTRSPPSADARASANRLFPLRVPPKTSSSSAMRSDPDGSQQSWRVDRGAEPAREVRIRIGRRRSRDERDPATARERAEDGVTQIVPAEDPMDVRPDDATIRAHRAVLIAGSGVSGELGERLAAVARGLADVQLVPVERHPRERREDAARRDAPVDTHGPLLPREDGPDREEREAADDGRGPFHTAWIGELFTEHLESAADA